MAFYLPLCAWLEWKEPEGASDQLCSLKPKPLGLVPLPSSSCHVLLFSTAGFEKQLQAAGGAAQRAGSPEGGDPRVSEEEEGMPGEAQEEGEAIAAAPEKD